MSAIGERIESKLGEYSTEIMQPIDGDPTNKNLLSMRQFSASDISLYIEEAHAAAAIISDPSVRGIPLLPYAVLKAVMRQPSTRTGGSMTTATYKLGQLGDLYSGMEASSEAKGEPFNESAVALASQADILGFRTSEEYGPHVAAQAIADNTKVGGLPNIVPVINLGDGKNEHPTQALGDLFTIHKRFPDMNGLVVVTAGDQERYRAFHSLMIGAIAMGATILAVESPASRVPESYIAEFGDQIQVTEDLDEAIREADVLYMGRKPDEYDPKAVDLKGLSREQRWNLFTELDRSEDLTEFYKRIVIDYERLRPMKPSAIVMHPRPRGSEIHSSADADPRVVDVEQMWNMIPMRMAIMARHLGKSIIDYRDESLPREVDEKLSRSPIKLYLRRVQARFGRLFHRQYL